MALKRSQADGSPPKPAMPTSWQGGQLARTSSQTQIGVDTEAQRLSRAFTRYLRDVEDEDAFDFGTYNSLDRGQSPHPKVLAGQCKSFVDIILPASQGRIRSKQALVASINEMLRLHQKRSILGDMDRSKFISWLKIRVSPYVVDIVRVGGLIKATKKKKR